MTSNMPVAWVVSFFLFLDHAIRFQLALVSVNLGASLPWNVSGEPQ